MWAPLVPPELAHPCRRTPGRHPAAQAVSNLFGGILERERQVGGRQTVGMLCSDGVITCSERRLHVQLNRARGLCRGRRPPCSYWTRHAAATTAHTSTSSIINCVCTCECVDDLVLSRANPHHTSASWSHLSASWSHFSALMITLLRTHDHTSHPLVITLLSPHDDQLRIPASVWILYFPELCPSTSATKRARQRMPLPHISGSLPSLLKMRIVKSVSPTGGSAKMT